MNKFYTFSVFAVAFALVFGLGVINATAADSYNVRPVGQVDIFGMDEAHNGLNGLADRDVGVDLSLPVYGLAGDWAGAH